MVLLPNATVTTSRSVYSSGNTTPATAFATYPNVHVMPFHAYPLKLLPETAMTSDLVVRADSGTDMQLGDFVTSIVTAYTSLNWPENPANPNEILAVVAVVESSPGIFELAYRDVFIKRSRIGGGTQST